MKITNVRIIPAPAEDQERGLAGWASFVLADSIRIDSVAIRRTAAGAYALSYPSRTDRSGSQHPYFLPVGEKLRRQLEIEIFAALGLEQGVEP